MLQRELVSEHDHWIEVRDGDPRLRALYNRHYSARRYADGREPVKCAGPGEYIALLTAEADAMLIWRRFMSMDKVHGYGVNCAVFRNESEILSSTLIDEAMARAWSRWPGERLYTYVNTEAIRSTNPGYCFICAGWNRCGTTVGGLLVLQVTQRDGL